MGVLMNLLHVALVCKSEENSDKFYRDLLGLTKSASRVLPAALSSAIFGIDSEMKMINYSDGPIYFEIFIKEGERGGMDRVAHCCLEVNDLSEFLDGCRNMGLKVVQVPKGESVVTFINDHDGNLFEIKQK